MIFIGWKLIMKTLGFTKVFLLPLMILVTTMGSSIASQIPPAASPTLEESTSCRKENQEEQNEESRVNQIGRDIMGALMILNETLERLENNLSKERSSVSTQPLEK